MVKRNNRKRIHIGCGIRNFGSGWIHIDKARYPHIQYYDITKLYFPNESADLIYASHIIEYFDREEIILILKEWKRVLRVGGLLRLAVPDFEAISDLYSKGKFPLDSFLGPLYGRMCVNGELIYHKTTYDFKGIETLLSSIGFQNIRKYDWKTIPPHNRIDDHSRSYLPHMDFKNGTLISLNVECNK